MLDNNPITVALRDFFGPLVKQSNKLPAPLAYGLAIVSAILVIVLFGAVIPEILVWLLGIVILACLAAFVFTDWYGRRIEASNVTLSGPSNATFHDHQPAKPITYLSKIRLTHESTRHSLHSHSINYKHPQTSGQQQITAFAGSDPNDYWILKGPHGKPTSYKAKQPIKNGDVIRLEHEATRLNLHSHWGIPSPITDQQEVAGFGVDGDGDSNDNWMVEIDGGGTWVADKRIRLIHVETQCALHSHAGQSHPEYTAGQQEVTCFKGRDHNDWWYAELCNDGS